MSLKRRAQYLHSYLEEAHPELVDLVAYHWLLSGQSADSAVGNVARWKQGVPDNMVQVYGNGDVTYEGQIWVLDMQGGKAFFVFDRKHGNLPVAVFREADQTADGQEGVVKANEVLV